MKRRSFIVVSLLSLAGVWTFLFLRWIRNSDQNKILAQPKFLSEICNEKTIRMLGRGYLKLNPGECNKDILSKDLLTEKLRKIKRGKQDASIVESEIERKIIRDFDTDNIVVIQGWVLSVTEAKQCALFSILND